MKHAPASQQLCHSVRQGEECSFGPACRFSHDVATYMAGKPPDIGSTCVFYQQWGRCPFGLTCRFGAQHISPQHTNIVDPDKMASAGAASDVRNVLSKGLQEELRRRRVAFPSSEAYLKTLDGRGQKVKRPGQEVDGRGQEVDGLGQEVDRQGQEVDGRGQEVDGQGQEVDGRGQEVNGRGQETKTELKQDSDCEVEQSKTVDKDEGCGEESLPLEVRGKGEGPTPQVKEADLKLNQSTQCESVTWHAAVRTTGAFTDQDEIRLRPQEKKVLSFEDKLYLAPLTTVSGSGGVECWHVTAPPPAECCCSLLLH